jgi:hypothetical protein
MPPPEHLSILTFEACCRTGRTPSHPPTNLYAIPHSPEECSPFGSHILEALLRRLATDGVTNGKAADLVERLVHFLKDDLYDYISDKYATFFARNVLNLLAGSFAPEDRSTDVPGPAGAPCGGLAEKLRRVQQLSGVNIIGAAPQHGHSGGYTENGDNGANKRDGGMWVKEVPFAQHIKALAHILLGPGMDAATLVTLQRNNSASPFLQALLRALDGTCDLALLSPPRLACTMLIPISSDASECIPVFSDLARPFFLRMLGSDSSPTEAPSVALKRIDTAKLIAQMKNRASSHLIEALLLRTPAAAYDAIWTAIKPHFTSLCLNPVANFAIQSLIAAAPAPRFIADMVPLLRNSLADTVRNRRTGVACVLLLAAACWRTSCEEICALITSAFPDGVRSC